MIRIVRQTRLLKHIHHERQILLPMRGIANPQTTFISMMGRPRRGIFRMRSLCDGSIKGLQGLKPGLHPIPLEEVIAHERCPLVIIIARANGVHPKVDGAATSQHFPTRIIDLAAVAMFLWGGLITIIELPV